MLDDTLYREYGLEDIRAKVEAGERLTVEDGERLFACPDVLAVGALAHRVRRRMHGDKAYYVLNQHINYSNVCVNGCRFCAFGREQGDPLAFELSLEDILDKVRSRSHDPITEVHMVGGCHPSLPFGFYEEALRGILSLIHI